MTTRTEKIVRARAALGALISEPGFPGSEILCAAHDELLRLQRDCPAKEIAAAVAAISPPRSEWEIA